MSKFNIGDEVRITNQPAVDTNFPAARVGSVLVIGDYVSAEQADDGTPFYWSQGSSGDSWFFEGDAELVRSASELAARKVPTAEQIASDLGGVIGNFRLIDVDESDVDGSSVDFYGTTDDGLSVGFRVRVERVWEGME